MGDLTSRPQIIKRFRTTLWLFALGIPDRTETPRRKEWSIG